MSTITEKQEVYIGPERRTEDRRDYSTARERMPAHFLSGGVERRSGSDRRQRALAGIVAGLSPEDMLALRELWELSEQ